MITPPAKRPTGLLCDLLDAARQLPVVRPRPRFSWQVAAGMQTAYQLQVSGRKRGIWDSGKVAGDASVAVPCGVELAPGDYVWQVRTWDEADAASAWSAAAPFRVDPAVVVPHYALVRTPVVPVVRALLAPGHLFVDFGRAAFGTLALDAAGPVAGEITVHLGEKLAAPRRLDRQPPGCIRYRAATLTLAGRGPWRVAIPPDPRNTGERAIPMPPEIGEVLPFRYAEIEGPAELVARLGCRQVAVHYPFDPTAATFHSSSADLDAVWELCRYSIQATSFAGIYVDGDRERIPYEADAYLNQLCHYAVDCEYSLARRTHEYLLDHPTWPTEWILTSILIAWADYLYTGDPDSLARRYDDLAARTLSAMAREDGLLDGDRLTDAVMDAVNFDAHQRQTQLASLRDIVDWPPAEFAADGIGERDGYDMRPVNTVVNAFHCHACRLLARLAAALGRDATPWQGRAERATAAFDEVFRDPDRGVYVDGVGSDHASLHANMFALAFDLVPPEHRAPVLAFVRSRGMACSVYGAQYLLEALFAAGDAATAIGLLTDAGDRGWLNMLRAGSTVTLEAWDWRFKQNLDWNHAWGAAPANIIPRFVLGVRPLAPGWRELLVQPQPGPLTHVAGRVPTIRGPVEVAWEPGRLTVAIPANTRARVGLPGGSLHELGPGRHTLTS